MLTFEDPVLGRVADQPVHPDFHQAERAIGKSDFTLGAAGLRIVDVAPVEPATNVNPELRKFKIADTMELSIRTRSIELTDELRDLASKRMQLALDNFGDRIEDTLVYLMDLNGPRGGVDKLCQITIRAHRVGDVVVRETGATVVAALNRAARRAKYRVSEALRQADRPSTESIRTGQVPA